MAKLAIIADDLTGALDTGIKFAKEGIATQVVLSDTSPVVWTATDVVVICAPTRHVSPQCAYDMVHHWATRCVEQGIAYIYKKTDSVLRGNVGAELAALLHATDCGTIPFAPALPSLGRTTVDGVQYVHGVPIGQSLFTHDPLNPVTQSNVAHIITHQWPLTCQNSTAEQLHTPSTADILIVDAASDQTLDAIAHTLHHQGRLAVSAGCAGFASALAKVLSFTTAPVSPPCVKGTVLWACGTINPVTQAQVAHAQDQGFASIDLTPIQRCTTFDEMASQARELALTLANLAKVHQSAVFTTRPVTPEDLAQGSAPTQEQQSFRVESIIAVILEQLLNLAPSVPLFIVGGDTLNAFLTHIHCQSIHPVCELSDGVVLSYIHHNGQQHTLISKSGGFGHPALAVDLFGPG